MQEEQIILIVEDDAMDVELLTISLGRHLDLPKYSNVKIRSILDQHHDLEAVITQVRECGDALRIVICDGLNGFCTDVVRAIRTIRPSGTLIIMDSNESQYNAMGMSAGADMTTEKGEIHRRTSTMIALIRRYLD